VIAVYSVLNVRDKSGLLGIDDALRPFMVGNLNGFSAQFPLLCVWPRPEL